MEPGEVKVQLPPSRSVRSESDVTVRVLQDQEWQLYRETRLAALHDAPQAFAARHDKESRYADSVGLVCWGLHNDDPEVGELFGLWTAPVVRGGNVAHALVSSAAEQAAEDGCRLLYYWAASDNATAVGFASHFGFRS